MCGWFTQAETELRWLFSRFALLVATTHPIHWCTCEHLERERERNPSLPKQQWPELRDVQVLLVTIRVLDVVQLLDDADDGASGRGPPPLHSAAAFLLKWAGA